MGRGSTDLDSQEYDQWLAENKKEKKLRARNQERRAANDGIKGYHFGIDPRGPVHVKDKADFKRKLDERGLAIGE